MSAGAMARGFSPDFAKLNFALKASDLSMDSEELIAFSAAANAAGVAASSSGWPKSSATRVPRASPWRGCLGWNSNDGAQQWLALSGREVAERESQSPQMPWFVGEHRVGPHRVGFIADQTLIDEVSARAAGGRRVSAAAAAIGGAGPRRIVGG